MKVKVKNSEINLTTKDFLTQGGEGKIYVKGSTVFKILDDPQKMIPLAKMDELQAINLANIMVPLDPIYSKQIPIGFTMRYLKSSFALCQLFTHSFKVRHNLSLGTILDLIKRMIETTKFIHSKQVLVVDYNEFNFLVDSPFKEVYFIDTNSYQTKTYKATAIMDSIKDRLNTTFTEGTDWFGFGIVSFQMIMGIHPYKGTHKTLTKMDDRMLNKISVFNNSVSAPAKFRDFSQIPKSLLDWYIRIFEQGERSAPPTQFEKTAAPTRILSTGTHIKIEEIFKAKGNILDVCDKAYIDSFNGVFVQYGYPGGLVYGAKPNEKFCINSNILIKYNDMGAAEGLFFRSKKGFSLANYNVEYAFRVDDRIYFRGGGTIYELQFINETPMPRPIANVMENSTKIYNGVLVQEIVGDKSAYIFSIFPEQNKHIQFTIPELNPYTITSLKYMNGYLVARGALKKGFPSSYDTITCRFDIDYKPKDVKIIHDTTDAPKFVVLNNGTVAQIPEDGRLQLFFLKGGAVREITDPTILFDWELYTDGNKVFGASGNKFFGVSLR